MRVSDAPASLAVIEFGGTRRAPLRTLFEGDDALATITLDPVGFASGADSMSALGSLIADDLRASTHGADHTPLVVLSDCACAPAAVEATRALARRGRPVRSVVFRDPVVSGRFEVGHFVADLLRKPVDDASVSRVVALVADGPEGMERALSTLRNKLRARLRAEVLARGVATPDRLVEALVSRQVSWLRYLALSYVWSGIVSEPEFRSVVLSAPHGTSRWEPFGGSGAQFARLPRTAADDVVHAVVSAELSGASPGEDGADFVSFGGQSRWDIPDG